MKNELETLMAAAVMVADTSAVDAQSMPTYGSTWPSEVELWVVCSITTAPGARRRDACWKSSRNMFLLNGERF